ALIPRPALLAKFRAHLNKARSVAKDVAELVRDHRAALLCYEAAAADCHRSILAPRVARRLGLEVKNLEELRALAKINLASAQPGRQRREQVVVGGDALHDLRGDRAGFEQLRE